ncbi:MAG: hypothetical protein K1X28_05380 [Parachlamydiales bacterium]|nr:hypothetical protein [Parachlamydiales bacterium]
MDATHDSHPVRHEETVLKFDRAERYIFKWKDCVGEEVKIKKLLNEIRKTSDVFDLVVRSDWDDSSMSVVFDASRLKEASVILQNRTQRPKECKIAGIILSRKGMTQKLVELMTSTSYVSFELIRRQ